MDLSSSSSSSSDIGKTPKLPSSSASSYAHFYYFLLFFIVFLLFRRSCFFSFVARDHVVSRACRVSPFFLFLFAPGRCAFFLHASRPYATILIACWSRVVLCDVVDRSCLGRPCRSITLRTSVSTGCLVLMTSADLVAANHVFRVAEERERAIYCRSQAHMVLPVGG